MMLPKPQIPQETWRAIHIENGTLLREPGPLNQVRAWSGIPAAPDGSCHGNHCHHDHQCSHCPCFSTAHALCKSRNRSIQLEASQLCCQIEEVKRRTFCFLCQEVGDAGQPTNQPNTITSITGAKTLQPLLSALMGHLQQKHTIFLCFPVFPRA